MALPNSGTAQELNVPGTLEGEGKEWNGTYVNKLKVFRKSKEATSQWTTAENLVHVPNEVDRGKICTGGQSGTMGGTSRR